MNFIISSIHLCAQQCRSVSQYLLVAVDTPSDTLQLGLTDMSELELRHGNYSVALGDELAAVMNKEPVITRKCLKDLYRQETLVRMDK